MWAIVLSSRHREPLPTWLSSCARVRSVPTDGPLCTFGEYSRGTRDVAGVLPNMRALVAHHLLEELFVKCERLLAEGQPGGPIILRSGVARGADGRGGHSESGGQGEAPPREAPEARGLGAPRQRRPDREGPTESQPAHSVNTSRFADSIEPPAGFAMLRIYSPILSQPTLPLPRTSVDLRRVAFSLAVVFSSSKRVTH